MLADTLNTAGAHVRFGMPSWTNIIAKRFYRGHRGLSQTFDA